jgi:hypothetical protein
MPDPRINRPLDKNKLLDTFDPHGPLAQLLFPAVVIDSFQYVHFYKVMTTNDGIVNAVALNNGTNFSPLGYREHGMYIPGTRVLCLRFNVGGQVYILGPLPGEVPIGKQNFAEWIQQASGCTFLDELVHSYPAFIQPQGQIQNFNASRPVDSFPGELGWTNTLGMSLHMGLTSMHMRASDIAGLWFFYLDHQVRLAAHNYQLWTAGREEESYNDEGEHNDVTRYALYPWEAVGKTQFGQNAAKIDSNPWLEEG